MRSVAVVIVFPVVDLPTRLVQGGEEHLVEEFVRCPTGYCAAIAERGAAGR